MPSENVELIRSGLNAFSREGIEGLADLIHPDFEAVAPPELAAEPDTYRGMDGIRRWFAGFDGFVDEVRFEADDFIEVGECVVVPARLVGRGHGTGIDVEQRLVMVWKLRDGKAVYLRPYPTLEEALEAVREGA